MTARTPKLAATLAATLAAAGAALALSGTFASASAGSAEPSPSEITAPSEEQVAAFPILATPTTEADDVITSGPGLEALQEAQAQYAANPSLGRVVAETPAGTAAVVPGEGVLCLLVLQAAEQAGSFCEPNAQAAAEGLGAREDVNDERYTLIGVFPSSADASDLRVLGAEGAETLVALSEQAGYATQTATMPSQLRWSAGGTQQSRTLSWPALPEAE